MDDQNTVRSPLPVERDKGDGSVASERAVDLVGLADGKENDDENDATSTALAAAAEGDESHDSNDDVTHRPPSDDAERDVIRADDARRDVYSHDEAALETNTRTVAEADEQTQQIVDSSIRSTDAGPIDATSSTADEANEAGQDVQEQSKLREHTALDAEGGSTDAEPSKKEDEIVEQDATVTKDATGTKDVVSVESSVDLPSMAAKAQDESNVVQDDSTAKKLVAPNVDSSTTEGQSTSVSAASGAEAIAKPEPASASVTQAAEAPTTADAAGENATAQATNAPANAEPTSSATTDKSEDVPSPTKPSDASAKRHTSVERASHSPVAVVRTVESVAEELSALPASTLLAKQIALLLKINKELIRLCVDLQTKGQTADPIFKESATRLQANLAFLASMAEPSSESANGNKANGNGHAAVKAVAPLNDEPFPMTSHAPESLLPKLYAHLRSVSSSSSPSSEASPTAAGKKRRRETNDDGDRQEGTSANASPASTNASVAKTKASMARRRSSGAAHIATPASPSRLALAASPSPQLAQSQTTTTTTTTASATPPPAIARAGGPTPQQLQSLVQAFGQNAVVNLNALQSHYRGGQSQPIVAYMEANVKDFRDLPLQMQLQHMANAQQAAMQRQRQASVGSATTGATNSPGGMQMPQPSTPQPMPTTAHAPTPQRRPSAAPSPAPTAQSPTAASTMSMMQTPGTPVNVNMPYGGGGMTSPATSGASPGPGAPGMHHLNAAFASSQASQSSPSIATSQAFTQMASLPTSLAGMPAHLQQQLLQHFMQQQQPQQQQHHLTTQPMAPPTGFGAAALPTAMSQPMNASGFRPGGAPNLANLWAPVQQQQQHHSPAGGSGSNGGGV